jgi:hypothetical protein
MPHFPRAVNVAVADSVVTPISGNSEHGGACGDGAGRALYGVYAGDDMRCYRTIGDAKSFVTEDDSVELLSTIVEGPMVRQRNCALTNIDGTIFANVTGGDGTNFGQWIYRDTGGGGTGPWVLHGTVSSIAYSGGDVGGSEATALINGGEIVVFDSDDWATAHVRLGSSDDRHYGMSSSDDGGETWSVEWEQFDNVIGVNTYDFRSHTPTLGKDKDGKFWGSWNGNEASPLRSSSSDNTWSPSATVGENGNAARGYQFSVGDRVYAITNNSGVTTTHDEPLEYTDGTPTAGPWTHVADLGDSGMSISNDVHTGVYNIGSTDRPILAAIKRGQVLSLGEGFGGWRLWVSE